MAEEMSSSVNLLRVLCATSSSLAVDIFRAERRTCAASLPTPRVDQIDSRSQPSSQAAILLRVPDQNKRGQSSSCT
eukprot:7501128-Prorocentrum_lima.AAC.1